MAADKHFQITDCDVKAGYLRFSDENHFISVEFLSPTKQIAVFGSLMKGKFTWDSVAYIEFEKKINYLGVFSIQFIEPAFSGSKIAFGQLDSDCWKAFRKENLKKFKVIEK